MNQANFLVKIPRISRVISLVFLVSAALAQSPVETTQNETAELPHLPITPVIKLSDQKVNEIDAQILSHGVSQGDGQSARALVRTLTYEDGTSVSLLTALWSGPLEYVFFHTVELEPQTMAVAADGEMRQSAVDSAKAPHSDNKTPIHNSGHNLGLTSNTFVSLRELTQKASLIQIPSEKDFSDLNPCRKDEIPGFVRLIQNPKTAAQKTTDSIFTLGHKPFSQFHSPAVWVCATLNFRSQRRSMSGSFQPE